MRTHLMVTLSLLLLGGCTVDLASTPLDPISFSQMVTDVNDEDFPEKLEAYQQAHVGKRVRWQALIVHSEPPNVYRICPTAPSMADDRVSVWCDQRITVIPKGTPVVVEAVIADMSVLGPHLKHAKVTPGDGT